MNVRAPFAGLILASAVTAACFSEHTDPTGVGFDQIPDIQCSVPFPEPADNEIIVGIRNFAFHPANVTVPPGTRVTWLNCEGTGVAAHTTTADGGAWDSGPLGAVGGTFSRTFDQEGSFSYHCTPHPFMQGRVRVEG